MRICSMKYRDDSKNDHGGAVVYLTGPELITLNNIVFEATKDKSGESVALNLAEGVHLVNALVQHGSLDTHDILVLDSINDRRHRSNGTEAAP